MSELWQQLLGFFNDYGLWIAIVSFIFFVISIVSAAWIMARIPVDYFTIEGHQHHQRRRHHPILHILISCVKNLLGFILLIMGIIMLFTPGQGILSILFGLMIMNYPGKFRLECAIIRKPLIFNAVNAIRKKQRHPPLLPPEG